MDNHPKEGIKMIRTVEMLLEILSTDALRRMYRIELWAGRRSNAVAIKIELIERGAL